MTVQDIRTETDAPVDRSVREVLTFFGITCAFTWSFFVAATSVTPGPRTALILIGAFAPSLVAVALTARRGGRAGVQALLGRLLMWRVKVRWYVFALGYMAAVKLTVAVVYRASHGHWPHFGEHSVGTIVMLIVIIGVIGGPLGEEIGWRGYVLPRLTQRLGLAPASLVLGLGWSLWHLPLFVLSVGGDQFGQSFPTYLVQVTALSVAIAWLMARTGGSLLLVVLFHSAINQTKDIVPSGVPGAHDSWALSPSSVAWMTVGVLWVVAACFLSRMTWRRGSNRERLVPSLHPAGTGARWTRASMDTHGRPLSRRSSGDASTRQGRPTTGRDGSAHEDVADETPGTGIEDGGYREDETTWQPNPGSARASQDVTRSLSQGSGGSSFRGLSACPDPTNGRRPHPGDGARWRGWSAGQLVTTPLGDATFGRAPFFLM